MRQTTMVKVIRINRGDDNMTKESERRVEEILSCEKCTYFTCEQCEISYNDKKLIREYISKKDKIIDLMAEKIFEEGIVWDNKEDVKQYFENKAKEG